MMFVVARLSPPGLRPNSLNRLELPPGTSAEARLLRLIAKVPGLQKLGQVIARNQHLRPPCEYALARLETEFATFSRMTSLQSSVLNLETRLRKHSVEIAPTILSEASCQRGRAFHVA